MNPRSLVRLLLETSSHADQNVARLLANNTDDLMDAMRSGQVDEFLRGSNEGRALLNNPEFMRMTSKISSNLDYITRAGADLAAGRQMDAAEFLTRMDIPATSGSARVLTQGIESFNQAAARGATLASGNADAIAAARRTRAPRTPDISADELAERLQRARTGGDDAARASTTAADDAAGPAMSSADNAAGVADDALRASMPRMTLNDRKLLRGLESSNHNYAAKIELLLSRNVTPAEHARWMDQILVNARRGGLSSESMQGIEALGRTGRISADDVAKFRQTSELQNSGWSSILAQRADSLKASFENAAMHPFRAAGNIYGQSLAAPIILPARLATMAYRNPGKTAIITGAGLAGMTIIDGQTDGAASTALRTTADTVVTNGYSLWANWLSGNISAGARGLGLAYGLVDKEAAREWTESAIDSTIDVARNMPRTAGRLMGVEESTMNQIANIPVIGAPFRSVRAGSLVAAASDAAQGAAPGDTGNTIADSNANDIATLRQRAGETAERARGAGGDAIERGLEGLENFDLGNIMRNPAEAWNRMREFAAGNPTLQRAMEIGEQNPFLKWGLIGGFAMGALGNGTPMERISNGIKQALFLGIMLDLLGGLFGKPSLIMGGLGNMISGRSSTPQPTLTQGMERELGITPSAPGATSGATPTATDPGADPLTTIPEATTAAAPANITGNFTAQAQPPAQSDLTANQQAFKSAGQPPAPAPTPNFSDLHQRQNLVYAPSTM